MSLSNTEKNLVLELRKRFAPGELTEEQKYEHDLIRWIHVKNNNLDKAEEMLRKTLKWRKDNEMHHILSWQVPEDWKKWAPIKFLGYDMENSPVILLDVGKTDFAKFIEYKQEEGYSKCHRQIFERAFEATKGKNHKDGIPLSKIVFIAELRDLSLWSMMNKSAIGLLAEIHRMGDTHYPLATKKLYYINGGKLFSTVFPILKACMSPQTAEVMHVYNSPSKWMPVLEQHIPRNVLAPLYK